MQRHSHMWAADAELGVRRHPASPQVSAKLDQPHEPRSSFSVAAICLDTGNDKLNGRACECVGNPTRLYWVTKSCASPVSLEVRIVCWRARFAASSGDEHALCRAVGCCQAGASSVASTSSASDCNIAFGEGI
eukprot:4953502-Prymnesium_polylepis.1